MKSSRAHLVDECAGFSCCAANSSLSEPPGSKYRVQFPVQLTVSVRHCPHIYCTFHFPRDTDDPTRFGALRGTSEDEPLQCSGCQRDGGMMAMSATMARWSEPTTDTVCAPVPTTPPPTSTWSMPTSGPNRRSAG